MAPEEILSSVDASRREFLKKVIAGTTFAVPLMASFSMEGLSVESAWASNVTTNQPPLCSNMTGSPCCTLAVEIAAGIAILSFETAQALGSFDGGKVGFEAMSVHMTGKVVANGHFTASLGSSAVWGTFNARIAVPANVRGNVTLELYEASPKDGTAQGVVRVPLAVR